VRYRDRINSEVMSHFNHTFCCHESNHSLANKCPVEGTEVPYIGSRSYDGMLDVSTPSFKKDSALGGITNSPMIQERLEYRQTALTFVEDWAHESNTFETGYGYAFTSLKHVPFLLDTINGMTDLSNLLDPFASERGIAITQAWANVDESEMLALASLGELPETVRWLASLYRRAIPILKAINGRQVRHARKQRRMTKTQRADYYADFWLEARYAVRPLIFEAAQIAALLEGLNDGAVRNTARGFYESESSDTSDSARVNMTADRTAAMVETVTRTSSYRAGVLYSYDLSCAGWANALGFDKPIESIYELTKLSFMLDWFFNLGNVIASFTPSAALSPLTSWCTEEHTITTTRVYSDYAVADGPGWTHLGVTSEQQGFERSTQTIVRRQKEPSRPLYPPFQLNLDWAKCVDLATIARSIYRGIKK